MNYLKIYETIDQTVHRCYSRWVARVYSMGQLNGAMRHCDHWKKLSRQQKHAVAAFWGLRHPAKTDFFTHEIMWNVKGEFDVRYCPESVFRLCFDDNHLYKVWTDKNYYDRYQPALPLPHTVVRNVGGHLLDHDYHRISREEALTVMTQHLPLIVKPSLDSGSGKNVRLISNEAEAAAVFRQYDRNYLVQVLIVQCDELKRMSPHSVCTMRLVTAMKDGEPVLLKSHLLCNTTDTIAVNNNIGPGEGVVIVRIDEEGRLDETGYYENAKSLQVLPSGFRFGGLQIPSFKEAVNMALEAHESMPMLEFIGWDITIDETGRPVVIEWNQRGIEIYHSQLSQGPLFGPDTDYFAEIARRQINNK